MRLLLDSFWRAAAYCLHPRVIALSLVPLAALIAVALGLGYLFWDSAVNSVFLWLESTAMFATVADWLTSVGLRGLKNAVAPLIVVFGITPLVVLAVLLLVALLMMPAVLRLVSRRRFPQLERKEGSSFWASLAFSLGSTLLALVALVLSVPLWLIPPLILVLPPLIWGWLTYRVMTFDALAGHASAEERREVVKRHRLQLIGMGLITGYLGAAPSVIWVSGWFFLAAFYFLIPVAIWIYTLVFAFASLWFAHYCLAALEELRAEAALGSADEREPLRP
ncbi:MAG: EI24 domain-containing protein [Burkholderiales bacterium]|nr:EI24 domain-containing protein [Burkholderiales bacterium]